MTAADIRRRIAEQRELAEAEEPATAGQRRCSCGNDVDADTFNRLGCRCSSCYAAFCSRYRPMPDVGDLRAGGPLSWAYALRQREADGAALTQAQRDAWRGALGLPEHCAVGARVPAQPDLLSPED